MITLHDDHHMAIIMHEQQRKAKEGMYEHVHVVCSGWITTHMHMYMYMHMYMCMRMYMHARIVLGV